ncbi:MAG TPA: DUF4321 domain-containing protein [Ruminococcus sp.]
MKKTLYMLVLIISAIFFGDLIGGVAGGVFKWLGYSKSFTFNPGTFIDSEVFKLTFGIFISFNVCQVLFVLTAFFIYYKTAPKLIAGK